MVTCIIICLLWTFVDDLWPVCFVESKEGLQSQRDLSIGRSSVVAGGSASTSSEAVGDWRKRGIKETSLLGCCASAAHLETTRISHWFHDLLCICDNFRVWFSLVGRSQMFMESSKRMSQFTILFSTFTVRLLRLSPFLMAFLCEVLRLLFRCAKHLCSSPGRASVSTGTYRSLQMDENDAAELMEEAKLKKQATQEKMSCTCGTTLGIIFYHVTLMSTLCFCQVKYVSQI